MITGVMASSTGGVAYTAGKVGRAFSFNGTTSMVQVPDAAALKPANLSVEAWINPQAGIADKASVFMKSTSGAWDDGYGMYYSTVDGKLWFFVQNAATQRVGVALPALNTWTHVTGTFDGSTLKFYINGSLAASQAYSGGAVSHSTADLTIGSGSGGSFVWNGHVDELGIYNRALTLAEVSARHSAGANGVLPAGMTLNGATGVLSGTPTAIPANYDFTIRALDANKCIGYRAYTLAVNCPTITVNPATVPGGTQYTAYATQTFTAGGGTAPYVFNINSGSVPAGLTLNTSTGELSGTPTGAPGTYNFTIRALDANNCAGTRSYALVLACPTLSITQNSVPGAVQYSAYAAQTLTATGGTAPYIWSITSGALPVGMSLSAGGVISGTPTAAPGTYNFTVRASDTYSCVVSKAFSLAVSCPTLTFSPATLASAVQYSAYSRTITASGGTSSYTYSIIAGALPTGLSMSSAGIITGTTSVAPGTFNFTVRAIDANNCSNTQAYALVVACPAIALSPSSLSGPIVGTAYSASVTASGGTSSYTYSVSAGTLPPGLSLASATGAITGIPTAPGTFNFTLQASDANTCLGTRAYAVTVTAPVINIIPSVLPSGVVGTSYSVNLSAGEAGFNIQLAKSSTGIDTLAKADAVLAGTNRISNYTGTSATVNYFGGGGGDGNFTGGILVPGGTAEEFALKATAFIDIPTAGAWTFGTNSDDGLRVRIDGLDVINDDALHSNADRFGTTTLTAGIHVIELVFFEHTGGEAVELFAAQGSFSSFNTSFKLIGGSGGLVTYRSSGAYTWSVVTGALPTGLSLNTTTGLLSGTPTVAGTTNFTIRATDSYGSAGNTAYALTITCPTIAVTPTAVPDATVGSSYSQSFAASGGSAPYTWTVTSGTLPAGLTLSVDGTISGTPTAATTATVTIRARDAYLCTGFQSITINTVCPALTISPATIADATLTTPYSQTLSASGGTAPYTWAVIGTGLPPGVTLSAAGVLSGTPTAIGTYSFIVRARDTYLCQTTRVYTVTVKSLGIGNLVWADTDQNGVKDAGENGIDGVTLSLYSTTNTTIGDGDDVLRQTTTSSGGGLYSFTGMDAGKYYVKINTSPSGATFSSGPQVNTDNGADNDNNGVQAGGNNTAAVSPVITLTGGTEPGTSGTSDIDDTIDFAFRSVPVPGPNILEYDMNLTSGGLPVPPSLKNSSIVSAAKIQAEDALNGLSDVTEPAANGPMRSGSLSRMVNDWDSAYDTSLENVRTSLVQRPDDLWIRFDFNPTTSGTIGDISFDVMRSDATSPNQVRAFITWKEGAVYKTAWTDTFTMGPVGGWYSVSLPWTHFNNGATVLPTGAQLAGKSFLVEVYAWGGDAAGHLAFDNVFLGGTATFTTPSLSIGDFVFADANNNGVKNAREPGLGGVPV